MEEHVLIPFRVISSALADWWRDWVNMATLNLAWILCWLTVVLGPPATFAMYHVANDFVRGRSLEGRELPGMLRRYFLKSWLWLLLTLLVAAGVWVNLLFYSRLTTAWAGWLQLLSLLIGGFWLALQFYALPYLMVQEHLNLRQAYRNALLTVLASPLYSLVVVGFAGLVALLSVRLIAPLFLGMPCFIVVLGSHAVLERLKTFDVKTRGS